jgi:hypothetical protein
MNDEVRLIEPPHSTEAEQSLLGALLISNEAFDDVSWLGASAFYEDRHRRLWSAIGRLIEMGKPADVVTVCEELGRHGDLEKAGGCRLHRGPRAEHAERAEPAALRRDRARRAPCSGSSRRSGPRSRSRR